MENSSNKLHSQPLNALSQAASARQNAADFFGIRLRFCWVFSLFCLRVIFSYQFYLNSILPLRRCARYIAAAGLFYLFLFIDILLNMFLPFFFFHIFFVIVFFSICSNLKVISFMYSLSGGIFPTVLLFISRNSVVLLFFFFRSELGERLNDSIASAIRLGIPFSIELFFFSLVFNNIKIHCVF